MLFLLSLHPSLFPPLSTLRFPMFFILSPFLLAALFSPRPYLHLTPPFIACRVSPWRHLTSVFYPPISVLPSPCNVVRNTNKGCHCVHQCALPECPKCVDKSACHTSELDWTAQKISDFMNDPGLHTPHKMVAVSRWHFQYQWNGYPE